MFFPTHKTPNKGFLGVLHDWDWDPPWGPPETTPHFCPKWKKVGNALWGVELKSKILGGIGKFFVFGSSEKGE